MSANTIILRGCECHEEARAGAALKPGHLIEAYNAAGTLKVRKHSTYGGAGEKAFAKENALYAQGITDAYASSDLVFYCIAEPGDLLQARLPAAATAVVAGDKLVSNGDGTLVKPTTTGTHTLYANTAASAAVSNTTAETAFDKSYTIPANTLAAGDVITIKGWARATATNSTDTLNIKLKIGSTIIVASGALDVANDDMVYFEATLVVRTIGASGTFVATGTVTIGTAGTATVKSFYVASTTIDTTATQAITVTATWSVANSGNSVRLDILNVERSAVTPEQLLAVVMEAVDNSGGSDEAFVTVRII